MLSPLFLGCLSLENYLRYFDGFTCRLSGERSMSFGLLVFMISYPFSSRSTSLPKVPNALHDEKDPTHM